MSADYTVYGYKLLCQLPSCRLRIRIKCFLPALGFPQNLVIRVFGELSSEMANQTIDAIQKDHNRSRKGLAEKDKNKK